MVPISGSAYTYSYVVFAELIAWMIGVALILEYTLVVSDVADKEVVTIEGLDPHGDHPVQKALRELNVPQCGYCQSGQIMQAAALLSKNSNPTKEEVVAHMDGNLCRCMTCSRIQKAIMRAATEMRTASAAGNERRPT